MRNTAGTIITVLAIATVAIAWSHTHKQAPQTGPVAETIAPEKLGPSGPLPEQKFNDRSFVFGDDN